MIITFTDATRTAHIESDHIIAIVRVSKDGVEHTRVIVEGSDDFTFADSKDDHDGAVHAWQSANGSRQAPRSGWRNC